MNGLKKAARLSWQAARWAGFVTGLALAVIYAGLDLVVVLVKAFAPLAGLLLFLVLLAVIVFNTASPIVIIIR